MARHFLCCLPLRLGVFIISFLQFLVSGVAAGVLWYAYHWNNKENNWSKDLKISIIVYASVYTILALISFIGWVGAIIRKHGFVKTYSIMLQFSMGFQIGATIYFLVGFFHDKDQWVAHCINGSNDQNVIDTCNKYLQIHPAAIIIVSLIPIFIQAYAIYVVWSYAKKLAQEQGKRGFNAGGYQPVSKDTSESSPLNNPTSYPYSDQAHSFGAKV